MKVVLDENASKGLAEPLAALGFEVIPVVSVLPPGAEDDSVFELVIKERAILVTRDHHFTNPVRFDAGKTEGIIYIHHGNLASAQEIRLVASFLSTHPPAQFKGRLVTLYTDAIRMR